MAAISDTGKKVIELLDKCYAEGGVPLAHKFLEKLLESPSPCFPSNELVGKIDHLIEMHLTGHPAVAKSLAGMRQRFEALC